MISNYDVSIKSWQSRYADQMCCFFEKKEMEVKYTLWCATEIDQTNVIQWVIDHVDKADHVILIKTSNSPDPNGYVFLVITYTVVTFEDIYIFLKKNTKINQVKNQPRNLNLRYT